MATDFKRWGITATEEQLKFDCDFLFPNPADEYFRGISIQASKETIFAWLCQMRVAPYSYDWIDNLGRRSPQKRNPELTEIAIGQRFMSIFELSDFEVNRQITIKGLDSKPMRIVFGTGAISYLIVPSKDSRECRLIVKICINYPQNIFGFFSRWLLPAGDLIMMRKQLLNFKDLAEAEQIKSEP